MMATLPIYQGDVLVMELEKLQRRSLDEKRAQLVEKNEALRRSISDEPETPKRPDSEHGSGGGMQSGSGN